MSFSSTDFEKTVSITCNNIAAEDQNLLNIFTGLEALNAALASSSDSLALVSCANNVYTFTTNNSRIFQYTFLPGGNPPATATIVITSTNAWNVNEFAQFNNMGHVFAVLELQYGMTGCTITY